MTATTDEAGKRHTVEMLRKAIVDGTFAPGQRLVEPELAEDFGASRSAVRAALIDLTTDGLVERIPNKGARVRVVSTEEAVAIVECRMALDALCVAKAATHATDEECAQLEEIGQQLSQAVADGEPLKYSALNLDLYKRIRRFSGQFVAERLLVRLQDQLVRFQFRLTLLPGKPQAWLPEQLAIIDAIVRRQPDEAESRLRVHLLSVIEALHTADERPR
jgi:DNA-binding GntR family transcriptional regulator